MVSFAQRYLFLLSLVFAAAVCHATHQRSAEISLKHVSGNTYDATIVTFTFSPSPADRPDMLIHWGDGTQDVLIRTEKTNLPNQVTRNIYTYNLEAGALAARHTFPGSGTYTVWIEDNNRNYGILNIPNSINIPIYVETTLTLNPFIGANSTPIMLNPPLDNACAGYPWYYNAGAVDTDGDSLSYELVDCSGHVGEPIPGYSLPQTSGVFTIDSITGMVAWLNPVLQGEYNIAIRVTEWRYGNAIGSVLRDMQIIVAACNNLPPEIGECKDTCILAGQTLQMELNAFDFDNDVVAIYATGLPFQQSPNSAILVCEPDTSSCKAFFIWTPNCQQVTKQAYQLLIKATDNAQPIQRSNYKLIKIKVIHPAPILTEVTSVGKSMQIKWRSGYCKSATAYKVYRSIGQGPEPGFCTTGLQSTDYTYLTTTTDSSYIDTNAGNGLQGGIMYCYRIVANHLPDIESRASNTLCGTLLKDLPVITHVSFETSDEQNSTLKICWSAPTEIDTLKHAGPYGYQVFEQKPAATNWVPISDTLSFSDSTFYRLVQNPETLLDWYRYKIALFNLSKNATYTIGFSDLASSEFLQAEPSDYRAILQWRAQIPWNTTSYNISRRQHANDEWDSISTTYLRNFTDTGLENGQTYYYRITSIGSYGSNGYPNPLINHSEVVRVVPFDNIAPCAPTISHTTNCVSETVTLSLKFETDDCAEDAVLYHIYNSSNELIATIEPPVQQFTLPYLPGQCYYSIAVDEASNESEASELDCTLFEECLPSILVPNVLTPNADGYNDELIASITGMYESITYLILNRWGIRVFETTDPQLKWVGTFQQGTTCPDGTYYYIATIYYTTSKGKQQKVFKGAIELLR